MRCYQRVYAGGPEDLRNGSAQISRTSQRTRRAKQPELIVHVGHGDDASPSKGDVVQRPGKISTGASCRPTVGVCPHANLVGLIQRHTFKTAFAVEAPTDAERLVGRERGYAPVCELARSVADQPSGQIHQ